ncbi:MAG TPA: M28 family peptidase [Bacteroidota bacterium]|nr:M28 family peptidase [Bacteroidota bacterium]
MKIPSHTSGYKVLTLSRIGKRAIHSFTLLVLFLFPLFAQMNGDERQAFGSINTQVFRSHLNFLADDLLEGRGTGTRADALCQKYLATQLELLGLEPGGENGTYLQRVPIVGMTADPSMVLVARRGEKEERFKFREEYIGFSGVEKEDVSIDGRELVFVGFGIVAPEQKWDDYKGVDVRGKVLLMMNDEPASTDPKFFAGKARTYYGRWTYKYEVAAAKGAAGAIIIHTDASAGYPFQVVQTSWTGENFSLDSSSAKPIDLEAWLSASASERLVAMAGKNIAALMKAAESRRFHPVPLGIRVSTQIHSTIRRLTTANVGGLLRGSDPALAKQVVIYTAHFDHLGIVQPVNGDSIDNGAIDNASGVSMVLTLADAFVHLAERPRRSVLFLLVGGEEAGTLGSEYFAAHPTFLPAEIAADINIDGVNVYGETRDISMIGMGRSTIDKVADSAAAVAGFSVVPDQFPEQGSFYRSDQFSFAQIGIPSAYFDPGIDFVGEPAGWGEAMENGYNEKDYHQPSDEIRKEWTYGGTMQEAKFYFHLGYLLSRAQEMPRWNKGDEFESVRLKALKNRP